MFKNYSGAPNQFAIMVGGVASGSASVKTSLYYSTISGGGPTMNNGLTVTGGLTATALRVDGPLFANGGRPVAWQRWTGGVVVTPAASVSGSAAISFAAKPFTQPPLCTAGVYTAAGGTAGYVARVLSITTTGATVYVYNANGVATSVAVGVSWECVQMSSSAAAGG